VESGDKEVGVDVLARFEVDDVGVRFEESFDLSPSLKNTGAFIDSS